MMKNLKDKAFKYHFYLEHLDIALDLTRILRPKKTKNITFNKELKLQKKRLYNNKRQGRKLEEHLKTTVKK